MKPLAKVLVLIFAFFAVGRNKGVRCQTEGTCATKVTPQTITRGLPLMLLLLFIALSGKKDIHANTGGTSSVKVFPRTTTQILR